MLTLKQIENVCNIDDSSGKKCRYLSKHNNTENYICLKLSEQNKKIIDEQVKTYMCFTKCYIYMFFYLCCACLYIYVYINMLFTIIIYFNLFFYNIYIYISMWCLHLFCVC